MNLVRYSVFPVTLCMADAIIRSFYLRHVTPGEYGLGDPQLHQKVLCLLDALRPLKRTIFSHLLFDTRSCTIKDKADKTYAVQIKNAGSFWEILEGPSVHSSTQSVKIKDAEKPKCHAVTRKPFIITFNQEEQVYAIHNRIGTVAHAHTKRIGVLNVTDLVYCPGGEKPLKFISGQSAIYSFTFPETDGYDIYAWKDEHGTNIKFLHCDQSSGMILPISNTKIFKGTWKIHHPRVRFLASTAQEILTASLETETQMLYWLQRSSDKVALYRMGYGAGKTKMKWICIFDKPFDDFIVHSSQKCIYACAGPLVRLSMSGQLEVSNSDERSMFTKNCSALTLFEETLYIRWENQGLAAYSLNSGLQVPWLELVGERCKRRCRLQVVEADLE